MVRSIPHIIISRIIGFIIFLIILGIANFFIPNVPSKIYADAVNFFNSILLLLVLLMFVWMINEIFWNFYFPFNAIAPITSAVLGVYVVMFLYKFWNFIDDYIHSGINVPINSIYTAVALLSLIIGYIVILVRGGKSREVSDEHWKKWHENRLKRKEERLERKVERIDRKLGTKKVEWDDVGHEFKLFFYNISSGLNRLFEGDKKKKR